MHTYLQVKQSVPCKGEETSDELQLPDESDTANCSPSLQKQCSSSFQYGSTEQNHSPVVAGSNKQVRKKLGIVKSQSHIIHRATLRTCTCVSKSKTAMFGLTE